MINSAEEFILLRDSNVKEEYDRSAAEEAPIAVWKDVIDRFPEYRKWVAHNKTTPLEILALLCQYDADVRSWVAMKRKLSEELFDFLSRDEDEIVRVNVASNRKTPLYILERLAQDKDKDISSAAISNLDNRKRK